MARVGVGLAASAVFWVAVWLLAEFTEVMTPRRVNALLTAFAAGFVLFGMAAAVSTFWPRRKASRRGSTREEVSEHGHHQDCDGQGEDDSDAQ